MAANTVSQDMASVNENSMIHIDFHNENTPVVSSLEIAKHFQKKHKHVLAEIQRIISITPTSFNGPNFRPVEYTDAKGENRRAFQLTRDAFSLLIMGFTGSAAIRWKLRYIEAFNALEQAALHDQTSLAREAGILQGRDEALALPAMEASRKAAYLDGMKEGARVQKRHDRLSRLEKALAYREKGLTWQEIAKLTGYSKEAMRTALNKARALFAATPKAQGVNA